MQALYTRRMYSSPYIFLSKLLFVFAKLVIFFYIVLFHFVLNEQTHPDSNNYVVGILHLR